MGLLPTPPPGAQQLFPSLAVALCVVGASGWAVYSLRSGSKSSAAPRKPRRRTDATVVTEAEVTLPHLPNQEEKKTTLARWCATPEKAEASVRVALRETVLRDASKLYVVFDFDHTLSSSRSAQCHDHLALVDDETVRGEMARYLDFSNGGHPRLKGLPIGAWWDQVHGMLVKRRVRKEALETALKKTMIELRPFARDALESLCRLKVPVTVVSAGLEYVIADALAPFNVCSLERGDACALQNTPDTVHLVSNRIHFDENGVAVNMSPDPPVHAGNKDSIYARLQPFFDDVAASKRSRLLLVGDSVGDVRAATHLPKDQMLTVGFYNPNNPWHKRPEFDRAYDFLIPHTADFGWLAAELKRLL